MSCARHGRRHGGTWGVEKQEIERATFGRDETTSLGSSQDAQSRGDIHQPQAPSLRAPAAGPLIGVPGALATSDNQTSSRPSLNHPSQLHTSHCAFYLSRFSFTLPSLCLRSLAQVALLPPIFSSSPHRLRAFANPPRPALHQSRPWRPISRAHLLRRLIPPAFLSSPRSPAPSTSPFREPQINHLNLAIVGTPILRLPPADPSAVPPAANL